MKIRQWQATTIADLTICSCDSIFTGMEAFSALKNSFDVFLMAHDFVAPEQVENFKLETIANLFQIKAQQYHAAFSDAEVTVELFKTVHAML